MDVQKRGRGRPKGYKVTDETKQKIKATGAKTLAISVTTPDGKFPSLSAAGAFYKLTPSSIAHRCRTGARQRVEGYSETDSVKDYRGWFAYSIKKS